MVQALVLPTPLYEKTLSLFTEKQNKTAVAANKKKASSSSTLVVAALFGHTLAPTKDLVYDVVPLVGLDAELDEDEEDLEDLLQETLRHQVGGSTFLGVCLLTSKSTTNSKSNIVTTALRIMQNTFASFSGGGTQQPQGIYVLQSPQDVGGRLACEYYSCGGGASSPQKAAIESPPTSIHLNHITTIVDLSTFPPLQLTSPTLLLHEAIATTWDSSLRTWLATNVLVTVDPRTYEARLLSKGPLPQKKRGAGAGAAAGSVRLHGIIAVHTYIPDTAINDTIVVATDVKLSILLSLRNRLLDATDRAADDSALLQSTTNHAIIKMSFSGLVENDIPTIGFGNSVKDILLDVGVDRGALLPPLELGAKTKNNNNTSIASTSTSVSSKDGNKKKKDNNKNQKTLSDQQLVLLIFGVMSFIVSGYMIYLY
eukprot:PhF_6_TR26315/c0_g1_i2/m.37817